jgi:GDP-L-fucose synthase
MKNDAKIYVAGHQGLVGSSIISKLEECGYKNILVRTRKELELTNEDAVFSFLEKEMPEYIFLAAARVGGILANNLLRADFLYENLKIQNNVIWGAYKFGVKKLLFLGSSCIYPKISRQPIPEDELLQSPLEYTNEPYAIAKIAGIKLCESLNIQYGTNFIACMPTNLYGPHDNFDLEKSHVLPAILRKIMLAKWLNESAWEMILDNLQVGDRKTATRLLEHHGIQSNKVILWGSGTPRREFLYSEDLASACVFLMEHVNFPDLIKGQHEIRNTHLNIGYGTDVTIRELAERIAHIVGFTGEIEFDSSKPDGTPQKLMDSTKITNLGWKPLVSLEEGIKKVYKLYFNSTVASPS